MATRTTATPISTIHSHCRRPVRLSAPARAALPAARRPAQRRSPSTASPGSCGQRVADRIARSQPVEADGATAVAGGGDLELAAVERAVANRIDIVEREDRRGRSTADSAACCPCSGFFESGTATHEFAFRLSRASQMIVLRARDFSPPNRPDAKRPSRSRSSSSSSSCRSRAPARRSSMTSGAAHHAPRRHQPRADACGPHSSST